MLGKVAEDERFNVAMNFTPFFKPTASKFEKQLKQVKDVTFFCNKNIYDFLIAE